MFPPSCSGRDFAQRVGNAASNNPGRAARDRPMGGYWAAPLLRVAAGEPVRSRRDEPAATAVAAARPAASSLATTAPGSRSHFAAAAQRRRAARGRLSSGHRRWCIVLSALLVLPAVALVSFGVQAAAAARPGALPAAPRSCEPGPRSRRARMPRTQPIPLWSHQAWLTVQERRPPERCRSPARRSASAGTRTTTSACRIHPSTAITR